MVCRREERAGSIQSTDKGLWRQERGAEAVQLALLIPIVVGVILTAWNTFQLVSLRSKMRSTASQMAQYITAYAVPPVEEIEPRPDLCVGLEALVYGNFVHAKTNVGDPIVPRVMLYVINDPMSPEFLGNRTPVDCWTLDDRLQANQQFAVEMVAEVNWLWLGRDTSVFWGWAEDVFSLTLTERAFGVAPGEAYFELRDPTYAMMGEGPGGCRADVYWVRDSSFLPDRYEIYLNNDAPANLLETLPPDATFVENVELPPGGTSTILIKAICETREEELQTPPIQCYIPPPPPVP